MTEKTSAISFLYTAIAISALTSASGVETSKTNAGGALRSLPVNLARTVDSCHGTIISLVQRASQLQLRSARSNSFIQMSKSWQGSKSGKTQEDARHPKPSGWFGDFSQDESTYTTAGVDGNEISPDWNANYGRDPHVDSPLHDYAIPFHSFESFHESRSGGPDAAWQTHYPSLEGRGVGGDGHQHNRWRYTASGWVEDYTPIDDDVSRFSEHVGPRHPSWFDNSVHQVDGYGRAKTPSRNDGYWYHASDGWLERSVYANITCKDPGCVGSASLRLFDSAKEEARLCSISIHVHPTDYDDDWGLEHVEYWKINGAIAMRECRPRARGCNGTAAKPLYACLTEYNVDKLLRNGSLDLEGKNSKLVDECPHQQNLLSAVAMGTCMVRSRKKLLAPANPAPPSLFTTHDLQSENILKCNFPGCEAETHVYFSPLVALNGGQCFLTVNVTTTDYDDLTPLPEQIEFLTVEGTNMTTKPVQPGKNPCNDAFKGGKNVSDVDRTFTAVKSYDVTQLAKVSHPLGILKVRGKISYQVDECGYDGNLLHARVHLNCVPPKWYSAALPPKASRILHHLKKGLLANRASGSAGSQPTITGAAGAVGNAGNTSSR